MKNSCVLDILRRLGTLEWYSIRPASLMEGTSSFDGLPIITFRFKEGNVLVYEKIKESLLRSNLGHSWIIVGAGEKNLTLAPAVTLNDEGHVSLSIAQEFSLKHSASAAQIREEYEDLMEFFAIELHA